MRARVARRSLSAPGMGAARWWASGFSQPRMDDFREDGDLRVLGLGLIECVFDAAEVALAIAVDDEDLADGEADGFWVD